MADGVGKLLLTEAEACGALGVSRSAFRRLLAAGRLRVVHIGRSVRVPQEEVLRFVERLQADADGRGD